MHHIYSQRVQHKHSVVPKTENSEIPRVSKKDMIVHVRGQGECVLGRGVFLRGPS